MRRRRRVVVVEHDPRPAGSIDYATLLRHRALVSDADFCTCDPALGEHLSTLVESEDGNVRLHFYPNDEAGTTTVLAITKEPKP